MIHAVPARAESFEIWSGGQVPGFTLRTLDGGRASLSQFRGKAVLVHFFASWCEPCRAEVPALERFSRRMRVDGLAVLAVAVADAEPSLRRFFAREPVTFPVLLDPDRAVATAWAVDSLPSTVALDASLRPFAIATGEVDWEDPAATQLLLSLSAPREITREARSPQ